MQSRYVLVATVLTLVPAPFLHGRVQQVAGQQVGSQRHVAPQPIPIGTPISSLPFTVTQCGHYFVTDCLSGTSGQNGITIDSDDVTLDLNGFTLSGVPGSLDGVHVNGSRTRVTVRNGIVRGWGDDGIELGTASYVVDCIVGNNADDGIDAQSGTTVERCTARLNGDVGIVVGGTVTNCRATQNTNVGIQVIAGVASDCEVSNTATAYVVQMGTVEGCSAIGGNTGISAGNGSLVRHCTLRFNDVAGIALNASTALENTCTQNGSGVGGSGILVDAGSRVSGNNVSLNDFGIQVTGTGSYLSGNTAGGNTPDYSIAASNAYGPIVNVSGVGDISGTAGSNHPAANFRY